MRHDRVKNLQYKILKHSLDVGADYKPSNIGGIIKETLSEIPQIQRANIKSYLKSLETEGYIIVTRGKNDLSFDQIAFYDDVRKLGVKDVDVWVELTPKGVERLEILKKNSVDSKRALFAIIISILAILLTLAKIILDETKN